MSRSPALSLRPACGCGHWLRQRLMAALFLLAAILAPLAGTAQDAPSVLPQPVSDCVNDFAGLLGAEDLARIERRLREARAETEIQIAVATLSEPVSDIASYAKMLFNSWGVGAAGRDDGILILLDPVSRQVRVALGSGYDPVWDGPAQRAIDTAMLPGLARGEYAKALFDGVEAVISRVARPFAAGQMRPEEKASRPLGPMLLAAGFFVLVLLVMLRGRGRARPLASGAAQGRGLARQAGRRRGRDGGDERGAVRAEGASGREGSGADGGGGGGGRSSGGGASGRF